MTLSVPAITSSERKSPAPLESYAPIASALRSPNCENSASFVSALMKPTKSALLDPMISGTRI